jgi:catechol 2,3-dioxygenase-like lactoylglutathione lyase family enzyme
MAQPQKAATSTNEVRSTDLASKAGIAKGGMKLEVVIIPVSDSDRAQEFYRRVGWRQDVTPPGLSQFTPPGSWCSVLFGKNLTSAAPGSGKGYLIVSDIAAARDKLVDAGIEVSEVFHLGPTGPVNGPDPEHRSYFSLAAFKDPDGNSWVLQEITTRLPGRVVGGATAFDSTSELASALRRAEAAHGQHEKRTGQHDANWPDWYAAYMAAEQAGTELPS